MKNLIKKVYRPALNGRFVFQLDAFQDQNLCRVMYGLCDLEDFTSVKVCRGNKIAELHRDKYNNLIYREYEKN